MQNALECTWILPAALDGHQANKKEKNKINNKNQQQEKSALKQ